MCKKLASLNYVNRIEHETDTRAKKVSLTEPGKIMVRKLVPMVEKINALFFNTVSAKEQQSLLRVLKKLTTNDLDKYGK